MKRSILGLGLGLVFACSCLSGCELLDREKRAMSDELAHVNEHEHEHGYEHEESASKVGAVESKPDPGFFKGGRLSGGWSSDARDIERNLGVQ